MIILEFREIQGALNPNLANVGGHQSQGAFLFISNRLYPYLVYTRRRHASFSTSSELGSPYAQLLIPPRRFLVSAGAPCQTPSDYQDKYLNLYTYNSSNPSDFKLVLTDRHPSDWDGTNLIGLSLQDNNLNMNKLNPSTMQIQRQTISFQYINQDLIDKAKSLNLIILEIFAINLFIFIIVLSTSSIKMVRNNLSLFSF